MGDALVLPLIYWVGSWKPRVSCTHSSTSPAWWPLSPLCNSHVAIRLADPGDDTPSPPPVWSEPLFIAPSQGPTKHIYLLKENHPLKTFLLSFT